MIEYYKINESRDIKHDLIGKGLRNCLFVLAEEDYEKGESKFEEILKAVKLDRHKDILVWINNEVNQDCLNAIIEEYGVKIITTFGMDMKGMYPNMDIIDYQIMTMESYTLLAAPKLENILASKGEKMKLWKALQSMFLK